MSEEATLLLVLVVIYLADCLVLIPRGSVCFFSSAEGKGTARFASGILGNQWGTLTLANPLPLSSLPFLCRSAEISISPEAISSFSSAAPGDGGRRPQSDQVLCLDQIK